MALRIEKSFRVAAAAEPVWAFLTDPRRVASCLPGAAITEEVDAQTFNGTMTIKVGPVTAAYRGRMRFERLDATAREAEIAATGQETRGKGAADMRMSSRVVAIGPRETEVFVTSDVNVVGVLAQLGGRMIQDVSDQMFERFTQAMRRQLEAEAPAAPDVAGGGSTPVAGPEAAAPATAIAEPRTLGAGPAAAGGPVPSPPPAGADHENVLDLGALGTAVAARAAARTLRNPFFWVSLVLAGALVWCLRS
jgi:uncharacterized protein